jgi:putative ABC transport system permease protein
MFRNHLHVAIRNFKKKKVFTFINLLGITVGMTVCLLILSYAQYELNYDQHHSQAERIYRITVDVYNGDNLQTRDAQCYPAVGPLAVEEMPEIENYAMAREIGRLLLKNEQVAYNESRVFFANPGWLQVFDWKFIAGNPDEALSEPDQIILTESAAEKYFGKENPIGKTLTVVPGGGEVDMMVIGVVEDVPEQSHLKFDILISWVSGVKYLNWELNNWNGNNEFMYLLANKALDAEFQDRLNQTVDTKVAADREEVLAVQALTNIHLYSDKAYEAEANGSALIVNILLIVAAFVMLVAWVNYINLATAKSLERAREVGVRKVLGSSKRSLIIQFLIEAFALNLLALLLTLTLLQGVIPLFNDFTGLTLSLNLLDQGSLLVWLILLCLIGSFASGLYPAFVMSNYKPISVISGKLKDSKKGLFLRRGLVVFQFLITMMLLVGTYAIYEQVSFMRNQNLGFEKEQVLVLRAPILSMDDEEIAARHQSFRASLTSLPSVERIAFSESMIGQGTIELNSTTGLRSIENEIGGNLNFFMYRIDSSYLNTLNIQVLAGRNFDHSLDAAAFAFDADLNKGILINETGRKMLGYATNESAVGSPVSLSGNQMKVIGVIADYHHNSLKNGVDPLFLMFDKTLNAADYISIKLSGRAEDYAQMLAGVRSKIEATYPQSEFDYFFLDDSFDQQYRADQQFGLVFTSFSGFTILVALLGLFGLVLYEIQQRVKEIGIRKVLGASANEIIRLFAGNFMKLIGFAILISIPICYWALNTWLSGYAYRIEINLLLFVLPAIVLVLIALTTIVAQSMLAARTNPVNALRYE